MKYFKVTSLMLSILAIGLFAFAGMVQASDITIDSHTSSNSNSASGSQSGSVAVSGGGDGGGGGTGAANFSVTPTSTVSINSQGSDLGKAIPQVIAPALSTTLTETCLGSATGGLAVSGFGLTGGKTFVDQDCVARLNAREMRAIGQLDVAMEILCSRPTVFTAMARVAKRTRTLSKCSGTNPSVAGYDPMELSAELTASGGYDPEDDVYKDGEIIARWTYEPNRWGDESWIEDED